MTNLAVIIAGILQKDAPNPGFKNPLLHQNPPNPATRDILLPPMEVILVLIRKLQDKDYLPNCTKIANVNVYRTKRTWLPLANKTTKICKVAEKDPAQKTPNDDASTQIRKPMATSMKLLNVKMSFSEPNQFA